MELVTSDDEVHFNVRGDLKSKGIEVVLIVNFQFEPHINDVYHKCSDNESCFQEFEVAFWRKEKFTIDKKSIHNLTVYFFTKDVS